MQSWQEYNPHRHTDFMNRHNMAWMTFAKAGRGATFSELAPRREELSNGDPDQVANDDHGGQQQKHDVHSDVAVFFA